MSYLVLVDEYCVCHPITQEESKMPAVTGRDTKLNGISKSDLFKANAIFYDTGGLGEVKVARDGTLILLKKVINGQEVEQRYQRHAITIDEALLRLRQMPSKDKK